MPKYDSIDYPVELIREWIANGDTQQVIADRLQKQLDPRITAKLIYKVCKKHGIGCQRTGPRAGEGHPKWTGGRIRVKHGYVKVACPDHPKCIALNAKRAEKANGAYYPKQKYVWEHRLVMEEKLGRYLTENEVVHHIDGNTSNNALDNLMLFQTNADHLAFDLKGKCPEWSPRGKAAILAAVEKRKATARLRRERDAQAQLRTTLLTIDES